jgi:hypothetical protein
MNTRFFSTLFALLLVVSAVGAVAVVADDHTQNQDQSAEDKYSLSELREGGTQYEGASSMRITGDQAYWAIYWPADNPMANPPEGDGWKYLEPGQEVGRNTVYLRTIKTDSGVENKTVRVVYWQTEQKQITEGNTTTTETVLTNVTEDTQVVQFVQGRPTEPVNLRKHDQATHVTMWFEENPKEARWTFTHKSIATTQSANIDTMGDYWIQVGQDLILPLLFGLFLVGFGVKKAIKRAGIGPQWGYVPWVILIVIITIISTVYLYGSIAELLVDLPKLAAVVLLAMIGIVMLETFSTNVDKVFFARPSVEEVVSPSGDEGYDMYEFDGETHKVVRMPDGTRSVVKPGLLPFLSRVFGGVAPLEGVENIKSRVEMPESKWDETHFVDAESDEIVDYRREGWTLDIPWPEDHGYVPFLTKMGAYLIGGAMISSAYGYSTVGFAALAALTIAAFVRPRNGYARIDPAPTHAKSAVANMIQLGQDYDEAVTIDEAREENWSLRAHNQRDVEETVDKRDSTLIEEMLGEDESERTVVRDNSEDGEHDNGGGDENDE